MLHRSGLYLPQFRPKHNLAGLSLAGDKHETDMKRAASQNDAALCERMVKP
jgi:hypothetical protein